MEGQFVLFVLMCAHYIQSRGHKYIIICSPNGQGPLCGSGLILHLFTSTKSRTTEPQRLMMLNDRLTVWGTVLRLARYDHPHRRRCRRHRHRSVIPHSDRGRRCRRWRLQRRWRRHDNMLTMYTKAKNYLLGSFKPWTGGSSSIRRYFFCLFVGHWMCASARFCLCTSTYVWAFVFVCCGVSISSGDCCRAEFFLYVCTPARVKTQERRDFAAFVVVLSSWEHIIRYACVRAHQL